MNQIDKHPQRQQIIDGILSGQSLRTIGHSVVPQVHHTTLARFKLKLVGPAVRAMRGVNTNARDLKAIASAAGLDMDPANAAERYAEDLRKMVQERVAARLERRGGWISEAEKRPIADKNGNVFNDMDHRALSAHDRNEGTDLEFLARLAGLLSDGGSTTINMQIGIQPQQAQAQEELVIDVAATR